MNENHICENVLAMLSIVCVFVCRTFSSVAFSALLSPSAKYILRVCWVQINYDITIQDRINLNRAWIKYNHKNWLIFFHSVKPIIIFFPTGAFSHHCVLPIKYESLSFFRLERVHQPYHFIAIKLQKIQCNNNDLVFLKIIQLGVWGYRIQRKSKYLFPVFYMLNLIYVYKFNNASQNNHGRLYKTTI